MENDPEEDNKKRKERAKARTTPAKKKKAAKATAAKLPDAPKPPKKIVHKKLKVNFWRTRLHDEELGVHQQLKYTAKTR